MNLKIISIFIAVLIAAYYSNAQGFKKVSSPKGITISRDNEPVNNKGTNAGISLGFNYVGSKLYEAIVSPVDDKLVIDKFLPLSFVVSTGVVFPLGDKMKAKSYYVSNDTGNNTKYVIPNGWYAVIAVNLAQFSGAKSNSVFNTRIDGGLGFGYRFSEEWMITGTFEMVTFNQPREFVKKAEGQILYEGGDPSGDKITAISPTDTRFYKSQYFPSVSLKAMFLISGQFLKDL